MNKEKIEKYLNKIDESDPGVMGYEHPHGGRGRIGYNKGITCPHCGRNINLKDMDKDMED